MDQQQEVIRNIRHLRAHITENNNTAVKDVEKIYKYFIERLDRVYNLLYKTKLNQDHYYFSQFNEEIYCKGQELDITPNRFQDYQLPTTDGISTEVFYCSDGFCTSPLIQKLKTERIIIILFACSYHLKWAERIFKNKMQFSLHVPENYSQIVLCGILLNKTTIQVIIKKTGTLRFQE